MQAREQPSGKISQPATDKSCIHTPTPACDTKAQRTRGQPVIIVVVIVWQHRRNTWTAHMIHAFLGLVMHPLQTLCCVCSMCAASSGRASDVHSLHHGHTPQATTRVCTLIHITRITHRTHNLGTPHTRQYVGCRTVLVTTNTRPPCRQLQLLTQTKRKRTHTHALRNLISSSCCAGRNTLGNFCTRPRPP